MTLYDNIKHKTYKTGELPPQFCFYFFISNKVIKMARWLVTFAGGHQVYLDAGARLIQQANTLGLFDNTLFYTEESLYNDTGFWSRHGEFIQNNTRGFGYWLWKPYIIKRTMEQMKDGDILLYLDSGCKIKNPHKYIQLFDIVQTDFIVGTLAKSIFNGSHFIEKEWNKMDLILELNMLNDPQLDTPQRQAGTNVYYVCERTRSFVDQWYELACNYHLIDDSPSIQPNVTWFREHRHDQSIFSLLTKKLGIYSAHTLENVIEVEKIHMPIRLPPISAQARRIEERRRERILKRKQH